MNEIHLFPVCDYEIHLSTALACFWLSIMFVISFLYLTYLPLVAFCFSWPSCSEFLYCLLAFCLLACLLACFFSHVQTQTLQVLLYLVFQCFLFFFFNIVSVLSLLFVSHYSSFSHQFSLPIFPLFAYFLLCWSHLLHQNSQPLPFIFVYLSFSWLLFPEVDESSLLLKYLNI